MIQQDAAMNVATAVLATNNPPPQPAITNTPYPPDQGSATPPPPMDDSGPPPVTDNSGDYASADDTAYFYDSMAPYGSWFYTSGVGYCWQPTVYAVDHSWRPYSDRGRWLSTEAGWYWQSDYAWGWAPFHYGRWYRDQQRGWVWAPNRVWGPAWVSWRQSAEYCGWAPLPPAAKYAGGTSLLYRGKPVSPQYDFGLTAHQYIFIPIERMIDATPARYSLFPGQAAQAYQETKVVNNYSMQNNRVTSLSVDPRQVAKAAGEEVRMAEIHDQRTTGVGNTPVEHIGRHDDKLAIYRPALPGPDANFVSKLPATARAGASSSTRQPLVIGKSPTQTASEPLTLRAPPGTPAAAAEHKSIVMMERERHFDPPAAPAPVYHNDPYHSEHMSTTPIMADSQARSKAESGLNEPAPGYYPQSSVLTPSRSDYRGGVAPMTAPNYYQGTQPYRSDTHRNEPAHSEAPAPRSSPIYTPPAFTRTEPAPAPVYHQPPVESRPAPVESYHSSPQESHPSSPASSSSSSSTSSSSGHR
jgi:hypothetical protein